MKTVNLHQHTILIVNGNDHDRIALSDSLNDAGFGTVEAKNPKLAVIYFRQIQPDLVVMDLDLRCRGFGLCTAPDQQPDFNPTLPLSDSFQPKPDVVKAAGTDS